MSTNAIEAGHLMAFIERIERLEEDKKTVADEIKDVYAEAKGTGYDIKIIRKIVSIRKQDQDKRREEEEILDLYLQALGCRHERARRHTRRRDGGGAALRGHARGRGALRHRRRGEGDPRPGGGPGLLRRQRDDTRSWSGCRRSSSAPAGASASCCATSSAIAAAGPGQKPVSGPNRVCSLGPSTAPACAAALPTSCRRSPARQDPRLRAVADEAAESYYAQARDAQRPATQIGLRQAVIGAVHAALGPDEIRRMGKALKRDAQAQKAVRRAQREFDLSEATRFAGAKLGTRLYAVVYADPPWRFEVQSRETGLDRAADNHYPTMPTEEICALQVPAAPDAALFLWATAPMLEHGLQVLRAWGFTYRSNLVWNKARIGTGYWARNKHEHLLIGTRGDVPAPAPGTQPESVIDAAVGRHSEKPADFAEAIERMFPSAPKVELFARAPRRGWDAWGNEAREPQHDARRTPPRRLRALLDKTVANGCTEAEALAAAEKARAIMAEHGLSTADLAMGQARAEEVSRAAPSGTT